MANEKITFIPNVNYIDGPPEVSFIPVDEFFVFVVLAFLLLWFGFTLIAIPVSIALAFGYHKFKEGKPKNFYQTIPYEAGIMKVKGVPSVSVDEFME